MVKYPTILNLPQEDINRQLYEMILKLQKTEGADISALATDVGNLKTAVGGESSGLVKDIADIKAEIGDKAEPASGTIWKAIDDLQPSG
jgi:hypothetical protein